MKVWLEGHFDLIIADCNMPVMNGYDLTRAIRAHEQAHSRPRCTILGFTANAQPEELQRCRNAGMDACLFKPISLKALNEELAKITPLPRRPPKNVFAAFSVEGLNMLTGGRPELIQRLLDQLLRSSQDDRMELAETIGAGNRQSIRDMAHKIKGAARIIQASEVIEHCEALEDACDEVTSAEVITARHQAIDAAMLELEQALCAQQASDE